MIQFDLELANMCTPDAEGKRSALKVTLSPGRQDTLRRGNAGKPTVENKSWLHYKIATYTRNNWVNWFKRGGRLENVERGWLRRLCRSPFQPTYKSTSLFLKEAFQSEGTYNHLHPSLRVQRDPNRHSALSFKDKLQVSGYRG